MVSSYNPSISPGPSASDADEVQLTGVARVQQLTSASGSFLNLHKAVIDAARDGYCAFDRAGYILEVNQAYADFSGYSISELIGMHITLQEEIDKAGDVAQRIEQLLLNGHAFFETRHRRKDGSAILLEVSLCYLPQQQQIFGFFRDISARKAIEESARKNALLLNAIIDYMPAMLYLKRADTLQFELLNATGEALLGFSAQDMLGKSDYDFFPPEQAKLFTDEDRLVLASEKPIDLPDEVITNAHGEHIHLLSRKVALRNDRGEPEHLLGISIDITDHVRIAHGLRMAQHSLDQSQDALFRMNLAGQIVYVNDAACNHLGYTQEELLKLCVVDIDADFDESDWRNHWLRLDTLGWEKFESRHVRKDGKIVPVEISTSATQIGEQLFAFASVRDISERKFAEEQLRIAAATFETHEAIMITDAQGIILRVNYAFEKITGFSQDEVVGQTPRILRSGRHNQAFYTAMWQTAHDTGIWQGEIWDRRKSGEVYPKWLNITAIKNQQGEITQYVAIFSDITERKRAEEEIVQLAFYDALTKLPNRRLLLDKLQQVLLLSERQQRWGAVLFLDMDKFKLLNDTLGHNYGDMMLIEVADRIRHCVRSMDIVARLGGDEFVLVFQYLGQTLEDASATMANIAEKVRATLATPYHLQGQVYHSSPSIGACMFLGTAVSVDDLLKHADIAMYQAKNAGRNTIRFYDPLLQQVMETRLLLDTELNSALAKGQFKLYYQLQVDHQNRAIGAEALIRWQHPQRGLISPAEFIPIAEESSSILAIGHWVIEAACQQLARWARQPGKSGLQLAVNVSAHQFRMPDFVDSVIGLCDTYRIAAGRLKLELTESIILENVAEVAVKIQTLRHSGIMVALDDFGTGYSSLSYLKRLPIDQIKIDASFVRDIATDPSDAMMVKTIIDMANNFHLKVIAEGVETEAQLNFLKERGCREFQGYLMGKPVPIEVFEKTLARQ